MEEEHTLKEYDELATKTIDNIKSHILKVIKHSGLALSFTTITFIIFLYVYEMGYLNVFRIPHKYISINLQNYISVIYVTLTYVMVAIFWSILYLVEKTYTSKRLEIKEMMSFLLIIFNILCYASTGSIFQLIIISSVIAFIIEIAITLWRHGRLRLRKRPSKQLSGYRLIEMRISHFILNECNLSLIFLCILTSYNIGTYIAKNQKKYEIISYDSRPYAVITEHKNYAIIQNANICGNELQIDVLSYRLISKVNIKIEYKEFEKVKIKGVK